MHYSLRTGAHNSFKDRIKSLGRQFKGHNWLPVAATVIMSAWISLIVAGFQQSPTNNPGGTSDIASTSTSIPVETTPSNFSSVRLNASSPGSATDQSAQAANSSTATIAASTSNPAAPLPHVKHQPVPADQPETSPTMSAPLVTAELEANVPVPTDTASTPTPNPTPTSQTSSGVDANLDLPGVVELDVTLNPESGIGLDLGLL